MIEIGISALVLFYFGTSIGSFLHVVAERYMSDRSPFVGRSYCPHCKKVLTPRELVPIFSYIINGAKCRGCKAEIPVHYPIIEFLTGGLAVILILPSLMDHSGVLLPLLLFVAACILVILIRIDAKSMLLPDGYIYALTAIALVYAFFFYGDFNDSVLGALVGASALYFLWVGTAGRGIGFGDVKLMIPLGILVGLDGAVTLLFFSFFAGGAVSLFLLLTKRVTPKTIIPFGPFLAGAGLILMMFPEVSGRFFTLLGVY
jgi:prepilin signal peptidase PulO-like enzyme (type II secretory pathway)